MKSDFTPSNAVLDVQDLSVLTKVELESRRGELIQRQQALETRFTGDKEHDRLTIEINALRKKLNAFETQQYEREKTLRRERVDEIDQYTDAIEAVRLEIDSRVKVKPQDKVASFDDVIRRLCNGVNWSGKFYEVWVSPGGKFAIMGKTSGTCWSGVGMPHSYVPSEFYLIDLGTARSIKDTGTYLMEKIVVKGSWCNGRIERSHVGRLTKAVRELMIQEASRLEKLKVIK